MSDPPQFPPDRNELAYFAVQAEGSGFEFPPWNGDRFRVGQIVLLPRWEAERFLGKGRWGEGPYLAEIQFPPMVAKLLERVEALEALAAMPAPAVAPIAATPRARRAAKVA